MPQPETTQRDLMDANYRWMKYIYDFTRPSFLLGRNRLLARIADFQPRTVLEIGVGTGRNLKKLALMLPEAKLYGSDISPEMLSYAAKTIHQASLSQRIEIVEADGIPAFGKFNSGNTFDVVFFSYSLSMIPDWQAALRNAANFVDQDCGHLLIVDFGSFARWPGPIARQFHRNMKAFHVTVRGEIIQFLQSDEAFKGWTLESQNFGFDWALMHVLSPPETGPL